MRNKIVLLSAFLLFHFAMGLSFWVEAQATGPCRKIEKKSVCMPKDDGGGPGGGGCGCWFCKEAGEARNYTYTEQNCIEWEEDCNGGEICPPDKCVRWECLERTGQCWSEPNGVVSRPCPTGSDGKPDPDKCSTIAPPGYYLCNDVYDEGLHANYCGNIKEERCP